MYISSGSPPHMRGKVIIISLLFTFGRITPAHAGKSQVFRKVLQNLQDHPHTCGEKICFLILLKKMLGSPPHMRGKVLIYRTQQIIKGITPAHAGKSH